MSNKGRRLTKKQKGFADAYLETGIGVQSALKNYDTKDYDTANAIAVENLQKPSVQQYLEAHAHSAAIRVKQLSSQKKNLGVALGASKDILDRAGYKPVEKTQSVHINVNLENRKFIEDVTIKASEELLHEELDSNS